MSALSPLTVNTLQTLCIEKCGGSEHSSEQLCMNTTQPRMGAVMSLSISPLSPLLQFCALVSVSLILVVLIPFTKVEESFGIQAVHDFLFLSDLRHVFNQSDAHHDSQLWDHQQYQGVVHRTFLGPFMVAVLTKPFTYLVSKEDKFFLQIIARTLLSFAVIFCFSLFGRAVQTRYGPTTRRALSVLTLTQFHFLFYCSRTLPNTFALMAVLVTCAHWLDRKWTKFIAGMAFTVICLRVETIVLFFWIVFYEMFFTKRLKFLKLMKTGIPFGLFSLLITFVFDSYLWSKPVWPEGDAILFNIYENRSHEWGVQPLLWYFYSAVPRAMLLTLLFVPFCSESMLKSLAVVSLLFLMSYSLLPHKELRFVIYCIPLLNACAANTIAVVIERFEDLNPDFPKNHSFLVNKVWAYFWPNDALQQINGSNSETNKYDAIPSATARTLRKRGKHSVEDDLDQQYEKITREQLMNTNSDKCAVNGPNQWCMTFAFILMAIHVWCNVAATVFMSLAAWHNYPGGEAIAWLNNHINSNDNYHERSTIGVYVCNLAAQTGFTRFLEMDGIHYDKSPKLSDENFVGFGITYLVLEKTDVQSLQSRCSGTGSDVSCNIGKQIRNCRIVKSITGFNGLDFSLSKQVVIKTAPMLWIFRCQK